MATSLSTIFSNLATPGVVGQAAYDRAIAAGYTQQQILSYIQTNRLGIGPTLQATLGGTGTSGGTTTGTSGFVPGQSTANYVPQGATGTLASFNGGGTDFGLAAYNRAVGAGWTPAQIAYSLPTSGMQLGLQAQAQLSTDLRSLEGQARSASDYQTQLASYTTRFNELQGQYNNAINESKNATATTQRDYEIGAQLQGLRSGYTVAGAPGSSLNLLTGGPSRVTYNGSSSPAAAAAAAAATAGATSVLDNKKPVVEQITTERTKTRQQAKDKATTRTAATSGAASSYYANRYG